MPRLTPKQLHAALALTAALTTIAACAAPPPQTTRIRLDDMREVAATVAQSLTQSLNLASRTPSSDPIVLTVGRIENRSSDILTKSEQYYLMQSVARRIIDDDALGDRANIAFTMPAEGVRAIRRRGEPWQGFAQDRQPTHTINGDFRSITRESAAPGGDRIRRDYFVFAYSIARLDDGRILAEEEAEFERAAVGRVFD